LAKSARELVKTRSQEERIPGEARGRVTRVKVCHREALRSRLASSRVESMASSTPAMVRKAMGNMLMVWTRPRPPSP